MTGRPVTPKHDNNASDSQQRTANDRERPRPDEHEFLNDRRIDLAMMTVQVPSRWPLSSVRGCSEDADDDSAALVREITASTEPRMSRSGPLRTEHVGHSLTFVALCWGVWASGPASSLGVNGLPVMERSLL